MFRLAVNSSQTDILDRAGWLYSGPAQGAGAWPTPARDDGRYKIMPAEQRVQMRQTRTMQVYASHYGSLACGVVVMLVAVAGVLPLFYRFWALGRTTSMSPVEVAKAFGSPILDDAGASNSTAEEIAESKGVMAMVVRYGEVVVGSGGAETAETGLLRGRVRLRFGQEGQVADPVPGRVYG